MCGKQSFSSVVRSYSAWPKYSKLSHRDTETMTHHTSIKCLRPLLFITTTSTGNVSTLSLKQGVNHCKSKTRLWSLFPRGHSQAVPHLDKHTLNVNTQSVVQMIQTVPVMCNKSHSHVGFQKSPRRCAS